MYLKLYCLMTCSDKAIGTQSSGMGWRFFTKDKDLALKTAKSHIE